MAYYRKKINNTLYCEIKEPIKEKENDNEQKIHF